MTAGEWAFLALTVSAFAIFAVLLAYASWVTPGRAFQETATAHRVAALEKKTDVLETKRAA